MNTTARFKYMLSLLVLFTLLMPTAAMAFGEGKKQFKLGLKYEVAEEWDKAAEAFALAIADNPKNPEYRLHYRRALFNASQMYMKQARMAADQGDYAGAYIAFRKAYGYDPVNELAKSEMARMIRLQKGELGEGAGDSPKEGDVQIVKTSASTPGVPDDVTVPQRYEKLRDVPFPSGIDLEYLIRTLAKDLDLNVLFDSTSFARPRKVKIELKNVTAAQALDAIFIQEGLFFEKVAPRTIIVAVSNRRQFFQQLVLKTFYLGNADPADVEKTIKGAIPVQPGRTPTIVLTDEDTNSITVRDTVENIRLIEKLIKSLDKDRAEVVMDVQIYEVSKNDLLQLGNQIGNQASLTNLGGTTTGIVRGNGAPLDIIGKDLTDVFGVFLSVPSANIAAFQKKDNTKLLASTQIHAFNNEDSSARIGQRVPVQTASVSGFSTGTGQSNGNVFGTGYPVINYEQVGLTLKFKPIVFPNQDVQVSMEIESKDVVNASSLTPTFTERTIKGTARVQNNKTLLLASVAQGIESEGRSGLPLLGLIPILGRLFTAPTKDNKQVDIVIAVTPRVIRAPSVLPEDVIERPTGSLAVPTTGSLDALLVQEEVERQQILARQNQKKETIELPGATTPEYVKTNSTDEAVSQNTAPFVSDKDPQPEVPETTDGKIDTQTAVSKLLGSSVKPIETKTRTLSLSDAMKNQGDENVKVGQTSLDTAKTSGSNDVASLEFLPKLPEMKAGEKLNAAVLIRSAKQFRSAVMGFKFDSSKVAINGVRFGDVFGSQIAQTEAKPFFNQNGKLFVSLSSDTDLSVNSSGILCIVEIEALEDGVPQIEFDSEMVNFMTAGGSSFRVTF
ncbi:MAG: secretin N-terminal domain-containing protein [Pyrinomonadaceae bacterium]